MSTNDPESNMSTDLTTVESTPLELIQSMVAAGQDPGQVLDFYERLEKNRAAEAFGKAVTKFQSLCPVIHKGREAGVGNFRYSYASFDDVMRQALPALKECGLAVSFSSEHSDKGLKITCRIRHGTHFEDHCLTVPVPTDMKVNDTQKYGAALKYAQRYSFCAALNIITSDEDNDGQQLHESISDAEFRALEQLLMDSNSDFRKFCEAYQIDKVADLPKAQLAQARAQVLRKMEREKAGR